jgi:hypothetical protein
MRDEGERADEDGGWGMMRKWRMVRMKEADDNEDERERERNKESVKGRCVD